MISDPTQLLACAERIAGLDGDDATCRAAVSRAYYAAYHAAKRFHESLATPGHVMTATGRHQQLFNQLSYPGISEKNDRYRVSVGLSKTLRPVYAARVDSDYHLHVAMTPEQTGDAIAASRTVLEQSERWMVKKAA